MGEHTEKKFVYLRQKEDRNRTQRERVWACSLRRRSAVSQKLDRNTHSERSESVLNEEHSLEVI